MQERIIFDNYDVSARYDLARETLLELHWNDPDYSPSDTEIWNHSAFLERCDWDTARDWLRDNLEGYQYMARGYIGRWNGSWAAGTTFDDFDDFFQEATRDCDYWKIWDENGHLFLQCSHHDGTNVFEIKRITERALDMIEQWKYDWDDTRTEKQLHDVIWNCNFFSGLPHIWRKFFGGAAK